MEIYALKGHICYCKDKNDIQVAKDSFIVCENGLCSGIYKNLPEKFKDIKIFDYGDKLIIPGLVDLHLHAPQYAFRGLGMDLELIDWLNQNTFVEEQKYADLEYARKAYEIFVEDIVAGATTRACIFGTAHPQATLMLMEMLDEKGFNAYVGMVNMDRNCPESLCLANSETEEWIKKSSRLKNVKPILTPRFIPVCSDELMEMISDLQKKYDLPVQSHLSENLQEIEWVKKLCPDSEFYGAAYDKYGLFGGRCPTIMAHCVYSTDKEIELMKRQNVFVAHCPESNANLSSGIAPVRLFLEKGIKMGLGSDVAAGSSISIFYAMAMAMQCSKLRWRLVDQSLAPIKFSEAFYLATKGGGEFFGKVGSFEDGYEFDAVVIDDSKIKHPQKLDVKQRLERCAYLIGDKEISAKFIKGKQVF